MNLSVALFLFTVVVSLPMSGVLLYVWYKFGKGDKGVQIARVVYVLGLFTILFTMIFV
ncbi:MAG: hypothetical protein KBC21_01965 [Candidatus Pacebacteria bacterium]|nr:hypothetical protein [Candidatus Paceibacterota bacterium]